MSSAGPRQPRQGVLPDGQTASQPALGDRPEAHFAEVEQAGIESLFAVNADRIFRQVVQRAGHDADHDPFHLLLGDRAAGDHEVDSYDVADFRRGHRFNRLVAIDTFDSLIRRDSVLEAVDTAEAGAGAESDEHLGLCADSFEPFDFVAAVMLPSTRAIS